jgi:hypothetical protein
MQDTSTTFAACEDCDGFPQVAVTTGERTPAGERRTVIARCASCRGTGRTAGRRPNALTGAAS